LTAVQGSMERTKVALIDSFSIYKFEELYLLFKSVVTPL